MTNSNEYMREYMLKRYHRRRDKALEILGGCCVDCGTTDNLEFDHVDPKDKSFDVARAFTSMAESKLWSELHKCLIRCTRCHLKKTSNENSVGHGEGKTGKKNCRCDLCRPLKNAYAQEFKRRRKETTGS
jgi:5-methylcytosine-specific restriction endonuclease McrA